MRGVMFRSRLDALARRSLLRRLCTIDSAPGPEVELEGRPILLFSSNNYLDLAAHPRVTEAAINAVRRYGDGVDGDRKSTRLNSSHVAISYAVFCLKKKRSTSTRQMASANIFS